jgi:DNA-binding NtrC family response regulator
MAAPSTLQERRASEAAPGGYELLVMGEGVFERRSLPAEGAVVIGRGREVEVPIADPLASRRHARLRIDGRGALEVEDLGSANGTRLRDRPLEPRQPAPVLPGEALAIGSTILMVQPARPAPPPPRLLAHGEFEGRVEWECARAEATGGALSVARLHLAAEIAPAAVAAAAGQVLRSVDVVGLYGPGEYELLLPGLDGEAARPLAQALVRALPGGRARAGVACYPRDGLHAGALLARAGALVRPEAGAGHDQDAGGFDGSEDEGMRRVYALAEQIAAGRINVLVLGETGVGKEVLARAVHRRSPRAGRAFVSVNCAALSEALLESELFGHERGAFTGAGAAKAGLLETAPGGTVFLDEIGELPLGLQAKLLRVLEAREITRVGGVRPRTIDVRFVAATNRDLAAEVARGAFRRDLYFRLNGVTLTIPPLRERRADLPRLARALLEEACRSEGRAPVPPIADEAMALLAAHSWPGNVRELRNVIERALLLCGGRTITAEHLAVERLAPAPAAPAPAEPARPRGAGAERERVLAALAACAGNQSRAARMLGISRKTLIARLEAFGAPRPRKRPAP